MWAAVLHSGEQSALAGFTGLERLGMRGWLRDPMHVLVPMGVNVPALPGLVVHHTRVWSQHDRQLPPNGPACTTAARSAIDAARWGLRPRPAGALVLAVVQQRLATTAQLATCASQFDWMRNASPILDGIMAASGGADSWAEVEVARLVQRAGFPRARRQVMVETVDGPRRVDLVVDLPDGTVLVIEVDGPQHLDADVRVADAAKDAAVIAAGNSVLRVPVVAVRADSARVLAQLAEIRRAASLRAATDGDSRNAS
jgi:very-short-patch-repair endonuclease